MRKMAIAALAATLAFATLTAPAGARSGDNQRFKIVFVGDSVNTQDGATVVASGPITGTGIAYIVGSTYQPDGSFVDTYRVEFPSGSFVTTVAGANDSFRLDPRSCLLRLTARGTFAISDGTGAYGDVAGQGTFRFRLVQVLDRGPDGCSEEGQGVGLASLAGKVVR